MLHCNVAHWLKFCLTAKNSFLFWSTKKISSTIGEGLSKLFSDQGKSQRLSPNWLHSVMSNQLDSEKSFKRFFESEKRIKASLNWRRNSKTLLQIREGLPSTKRLWATLLAFEHKFPLVPHIHQSMDIGDQLCSIILRTNESSGSATLVQLGQSLPSVGKLNLHQTRWQWQAMTEQREHVFLQRFSWCWQMTSFVVLCGIWWHHNNDMMTQVKTNISWRNTCSGRNASICQSLLPTKLFGSLPQQSALSIACRSLTKIDCIWAPALQSETPQTHLSADLFFAFLGFHKSWTKTGFLWLPFHGLRNVSTNQELCLDCNCGEFMHVTPQSSSTPKHQHQALARKRTSKSKRRQSLCPDQFMSNGTNGNDAAFNVKDVCFVTEDHGWAASLSWNHHIANESLKHCRKMERVHVGAFFWLNVSRVLSILWCSDSRQQTK